MHKRVSPPFLHPPPPNGMVPPPPPPRPLFAAFGSSQASIGCYLLRLGEVKPCLDAIRIFTI